MRTDLLVSIVCTTFQHKNFIRRTLDGFIQQRTTFPFEVIVHDDASTDGTAEIIQEYAEWYPEVIKPILQHENQFSKAPGSVVKIAYGAAIGKYIAFCEGDDHWTDPLKLQKQVDAMKATPEATGCFSDAWNERSGIRTPYLDGKYAAPPKHKLLTQREMILGQGVPNCTLMFRHDQLYPLPEALQQTSSGDSIMYVHLTRNGPLLYIPDRTAVRVMHSGGIHALTNRLHRIKIKEQVWPLLDEMTQGRFRTEIARMFNGMYGTAWERALKEGDQAVLRHIWPQLAKRRHLMGWSLARTALNWARAWAPAMANAVERRRG